MTESAPTVVADAEALRQLEAAAWNLPSAGVSVALMAAGVNPEHGLAGVPMDRVAAVCAFLTVSPRVDIVEPPTSQEVFEGASVEGIREHRAKVNQQYGVSTGG
jgi:hypothetical protein